jgi:cysteinyl-tRNA synthetase
MSQEHLGDSFDIHGGGSDLRFPHHENEIAQSEAATGKPFANAWMHTGMIRINKEKMSKSLNNFFTIEDVLTQYPAEAVRYFLLSGHYRSGINYSEENLLMAKAAIERLYTALRGLPDGNIPNDSKYVNRFADVMNDDFNTPEALAVLFDLSHSINRFRDQGNLEEAANHGALLKHLGDILGILQENPDHYLQGDINVDDGEINQLIKAREQARSDKDWAESDRIRDELSARGIVLEDTADGTSWRKE